MIYEGRPVTRCALYSFQLRENKLPKKLGTTSWLERDSDCPILRARDSLGSLHPVSTFNSALLLSDNPAGNSVYHSA